MRQFERIIVAMACVTWVGLASDLPLGADEAAPKPPWQRLLQGDEAHKAAQQEKKLAQLQEAGKFAQALPLAEALAKRRAEIQGEDHWEAVNARWEVDALRRVLRQGEKSRQQWASTLAVLRQAEALVAKGRHKEAQPLREQILTIRRQVLGEDHPHTANSYDRVASNLNAQGRYTEAAGGYRKALAIYRQVLGEHHPDTATSYNNVAYNLNAQGLYAEAAEGYSKALAIRQKVLGEDHADTATSYNNLALNLQAQGRYAEAAEGLRKALAIWRKVLGEDHPRTAQGNNNVAYNLQAQGRYAEAAEGFRKALAIRLKVLGEDHPDTAGSYNNVAYNLQAQGRYAEAAEGFRKALAIHLKVLGEDHPDTARSYNNMAANLQDQGRYPQAAEGFAKALAIRRKLLGEGHPDTANSYNDEAHNFQAQARFVEAAEGYGKALAIYRKVLGENHPHTATCYNNGATILNWQGRHAEAAEGFRKALAIKRKALGEEHPSTASSYNNLAFTLQAQGRYPEAAEFSRKALAIRRKVLGEDHPDTAISYNNVAGNLNAQGRYTEAAESFRKALAIRQKVLGEDHPVTAASYNAVAYNLQAQRRYAEAAEDIGKALAIRRKILGEDHPDTAQSYNNVAANLNAQGHYAEAAEGYRKALAIHRKFLSEDHPYTIISYNSLARNLHAQARYAEAEHLWLVAADHFAKTRLHIAASGLGRATKTGETSPLPSLAAVLARNGKPEAAWKQFEESLARSTWDDLSARLRRPPAEQAKQTELSARLQRLDLLIEKTFTDKPPPSAQEAQRKDLLTERRQVQDELDAFAHHLEQTYGPVAGQIFERAKIQAALSADTALLGWLDLPGQPKAADPNGDHWAVLLRAAGAPVWVRLRGTGPGDAWTEADTRLPADLRAALHTPRGDWQSLARRLRAQRLEPLAKHLAASDSQPAVRHLITLPAGALAGVPVEVFAPGYTVSYMLSGTLHAHLRAQPPLTTQGLLALADPVFDAPIVTAKPLPLPPGGVLLTLVVPGGNAAQAGLKPNDVLLRYHDTDLAGPADLKVLPQAKEADERVPLTIWREGHTFQRQVRPGKLGVVFAGEPAPKALTEQRRLDRKLTLAARGGDEEWAALPGTRAEVEALRRLFGSAPAPKLLVDSQASEQQLYDVAASGELGRYRYVHLATHGVMDDQFPLRSAVLLARDALPDPAAQLEKGLPLYEGRLTAEKVLRQWQLHSELVTLSACQTALGKYERGEGYVGFAQALLLAGSRAVVLSLWKVDDTATALLMERFYQNLLGTRDGLNAPLPKAQALAEAKTWLRSLSRAEALLRTAQLSQGVARSKGRPALPPLPALPAAPAETPDAPPYAHPYYWAAFVLIGDPR
jgi:tetratricopeptide (TPR) repeat protein